MATDGTPRITWHGRDFAATIEIVKLGEIETSVEVPDLPDPWLRRFIAGLVACERIERAASHLAPAHVLEMAACRFIENGGTVESWRRYETELGVQKSATRQPRSLIQPFLRWSRGGQPDHDGRLARLSAAFDAWLALENRPDPYSRNDEPGTSRLAEWLAAEGGYQNVAGNYSESIPQFAVHVGNGKARPKGEAKYLALRAIEGSEEWYTPLKIFTAMNVMFDLDPASPGKDIVHWIPAKRHFVKEEDGLRRDWGNDFVWLNAPHSKNGLLLWIEKFEIHKNGVLLCVDRTSTKWWQSVASNADLILQVNQNINFINPTNDPSNHNALGSSLVAYGPRGVEALINAASNGLGTLFVPYEKSRGPAIKGALCYLESNSESEEPAVSRPPTDEAPPLTESKENEIAELKARIAALEAENVTLKARIDELAR